MLLLFFICFECGIEKVPVEQHRMRPFDGGVHMILHNFLSRYILHIIRDNNNSIKFQNNE